jgi:aminoglycoside phosphotransferase (APT) family kinase protein
VNTVLFGGDGYCLHTSLQEYSQETAELLRKLQTLVYAYKDEPHETNDVVHGDFQPSNLLVHDQEISGVIDWEAVSAGDCSFDIATLLFYSYDDLEVRKQLWQYVLERATLNLLSVYIVHLILRQVDWSIRHHNQTTIERFLNRSKDLLDDIAGHSHRSH